MGRAGSARALVVAALLGLVPLACHGDDGDTDGGSSTTGGGMNTDEVAGFWQIDLLGLGGGEVLRDGDPIALRGAVEITAITAVEGAFRSRYILLDDGLPSDLPGIINATFVLGDDGRWLVSPLTGGLHVFTFERVDARMILTFDPDDPRNDADAPTMPTRIEVTRRPEPEGKPVGTWNLTEMTLPSGAVVDGDGCFLGDDMSYETYSLGLDIDRFYGFSRKTSDDLFFDPECTMDADSFFALSTGVAEDLGDRLLTWLVLEDGFGLSAEYVEYDMNRAGDLLTLTRIACLPRPDCEDNLPLSITVVLTGL
ncbi:MAG: hypothetical protein KC420_04785 [Myxococcales bacterium]|nr:hypothetical protein [Myxococcales bacterium]MCB9565647.1 hypothetical protein [Myxococcales bacterium]MCB9703197.1 hypothetical protein [Myxococcales bacterium]